ncbi:MAM and LDL-receptor class A domain-containing protein 1-like isoform X2 [Mercenaria mercenaria]|uniref:MAM and LDL-receptor class A domain-containing protein 1-like isoform X2 n=1 Tax=Mercenaria mercenaria TaxID=6596 RepID=UPI00234F10CB|nr:MAM and LDL-receptor class A domain-containing protein 1-like isoform X2 [Mercenaria mercenaria]
MCNVRGCGYKHPPSNTTKCFSCNEVYDGGPPCINTVDCDLKVYACSVSLSRRSIYPHAYELGCKFKRMQCDLFLSLNADLMDKNVKCCDTTLCNASPYNRKVNQTAIAMNFTCPTGIVRPSTTPTTTTTTMTTTARPSITTDTTTATTTTIATTARPTNTTDTTTTKTTTIATTTVRYPNQCSFDENNLCSWTQSSDDNFNWTLQDGPTDSADTGPSVDHSIGNDQGKYLYIESSSPRKQGEFARLESPTLSSRRKTCMSLWYYMYGDGIGNLTILIQKGQNTKSENVLFNISGNQGQRWCPAVVEIPALSMVYDYTLVIQGDVGSTYHGDIAIDDLLISETACTVTKCNKPSVSASIVG